MHSCALVWALARVFDFHYDRTAPNKYNLLYYASCLFTPFYIPFVWISFFLLLVICLLHNMICPYCLQSWINFYLFWFLLAATSFFKDWYWIDTSSSLELQCEEGFSEFWNYTRLKSWMDIMFQSVGTYRIMDGSLM